MTVLDDQDFVSLKFDGIWAAAHFIHDQVLFYSRNNQLKLKRNRYNYERIIPNNSILIGELMYGQQWANHPSRKGKFYAFDAVRIGDSDFQTAPFHARYAHLENFSTEIVQHFANAEEQLRQGLQLVKQFPIRYVEELWQQHVLTGEFEGLVFRRADGDYFDTLKRCKLHFNVDAFVTGFEEGSRRLAGTLGALVCKQSTDGPEFAVGGGLSDSLRHEIWANKSAYLNRWCIVETEKLFESGIPRHPRFIGWRYDK